MRPSQRVKLLSSQRLPVAFRPFLRQLRFTAVADDSLRRIIVDVKINDAAAPGTLCRSTRGHYASTVLMAVVLPPVLVIVPEVMYSLIGLAPPSLTLMTNCRSLLYTKLKFSVPDAATLSR